ncbi:hypothetical protein JG687_00010821 [Phytophthora cactorum]|uniref:Uncharacterized protein n=2 Tax=Phytophthora TaxID=4783 RepID=A0A8J5M756_9STRA|nr:hypothetical protein JG687_00010821 [Phytophthora cactorum]KAG6962139.1 hypothetical protein JG688_00008752 [Phytophthora aleatoria]
MIDWIQTPGINALSPSSSSPTNSETAVTGSSYSGQVIFNLCRSLMVSVSPAVNAARTTKARLRCCRSATFDWSLSPPQTAASRR